MDDLDDLLNVLNAASSSTLTIQCDPVNQTSNLKRDDIAVSEPSLYKSKQLSESSKTITEKTPNICFICETPILKGGMKFKGKAYHNEHYKCSEKGCGKSLLDVKAYERDGRLICERCLKDRSCERCSFCNELIREGVTIKALGTTFHQDHFFCCQCGKSINDTEKFFEENGKPYCEEDYGVLFAKKCEQCQTPVIGKHIEAMSKSWHLECFSCQFDSCQTAISPLHFFEYNSQPYCELHFHKMSKKTCSSCDKPIRGTHVVALGKKFHTDHFKCTFCQKVLIEFKSKNNNPYCPSCHVKLFE